MQEFVGSQGKVWRRIQTLARARGQKLAAIAYFTDSEIISFSIGDIVVVDASTAAIKSAQTSKTAIRDLCEAGVDVYSVPGLHAKVLILGPTLVVGSMNVSRSSVSGLIEAAVIIDDPTVVNDAREWITGMIEQDAIHLDKIELARLMKIKVAARQRGMHVTARSRGKKAYSSMPASKRWWYLGVGLGKMRGTELDRVERIVERDKENLIDTGLEVEAIELNLSVELGPQMRRGDNLFCGYMHNLSRSTVLRNVKVRRNFVAGGKRYIVITYPKASLRSEAPWGKFKNVFAAQGKVLRRPYGTCRLDADAAAAILSDWRQLTH